MHYIAVATFLFFAASTRAHPMLLAYRQHETFVKQFPCENPQPRVLELDEVIGEDVLKEKTNNYTEKISPIVTVLHRCYSSGCCQNPDQKCTPLETEDVTLTFMIAGTSVKYLEVAAVNHTRCGCQ